MAEQNIQHNTACRNPQHSRHLCYIVSQGFHLSDKQEYEQLISDPKFRCRHCGKTAHSDKNLCEPVKI
ncbi:MAG: hypothetical protein ABIG61_11430 [Planctomycetota bacterium]